MRRIQLFTMALLLSSVSASRMTAAMPDPPDSSAAAPAPNVAAPAAPAKGSSEGRIPIGIGVKVSTLGIGGEVAIAVSHRTNVRFGFNAFTYGHTFDKDGATYKGNLDLRSAQATYDIFFLKGLHLSPGVLFYNGNQVTANVSVPGGQTFSLSNTTYMIGAAYQGPPRVVLNLGGSACDSTGLFCRSIASDPTIQSNIVAEQAKLNRSASPYKFYPVISFGVGYKF